MSPGQQELLMPVGTFPAVNLIASTPSSWDGTACVPAPGGIPDSSQQSFSLLPRSAPSPSCCLGSHADRGLALRGPPHWGGDFPGGPCSVGPASSSAPWLLCHDKGFLTGSSSLFTPF